MSADDVSSDEWFARYLLDAGLLIALVLTAIGVALYLDGGAHLRDFDKEPGAGFLVCMVLCPVLAVVTLGLVIYACIRLFLRPCTFGHVLVRLSLLVAHAFVFLVCIDTISSTTTSLVGSFRQLSSETGSPQSWSVLEAPDFSGSQYDMQDGSPEGPGLDPGPMGPQGGSGPNSR